MKKPLTALLFTSLFITTLILSACAPANAQSAAPVGSTDPQKLLIPRWFLNSLTLDGKAIAIPAEQQAITIQFKENGDVGGTGGCNSFGSTYKAGKDGKLTVDTITSTMMACAQTGQTDPMQIESAYFAALSKVQRFAVDQGKLTLTSADGKTSLVYRMPPK